MRKKSLVTNAPKSLIAFSGSKAGLCQGWIPLCLHWVSETLCKIRDQNPDFHFILYFFPAKDNFSFQRPLACVP